MSKQAQKSGHHQLHRSTGIYTFTILSLKRITESKQWKKSSVFNVKKRWSPQRQGNKRLPLLIESFLLGIFQ